MAISVLVWAMMGMAFWHLAVLGPDGFLGGIIGAFMAAVGRCSSLRRAPGHGARDRVRLTVAEGRAARFAVSRRALRGMPSQPKPGG